MNILYVLKATWPQPHSTATLVLNLCTSNMQEHSSVPSTQGHGWRSLLDCLLGAPHSCMGQQPCAHVAHVAPLHKPGFKYIRYPYQCLTVVSSRNLYVPTHLVSAVSSSPHPPCVQSIASTGWCTGWCSFLQLQWDRVEIRRSVLGLDQLIMHVRSVRYLPPTGHLVTWSEYQVYDNHDAWDRQLPLNHEHNLL